MQLTRFTDYSLRTLIFLGAHPDRLCTIAQIAAAYSISGNHLMKVVNRLSGCGYVEAVRGKGGGLRLSRAPRLIPLGAVVRAMEERFDIVECFDPERQSCPLLPGCTLKSILGEARRQFLSTLDGYCLDDLLGADLSRRLEGLPASHGGSPKPRRRTIALVPLRAAATSAGAATRSAVKSVKRKR